MRFLPPIWISAPLTPEAVISAIQSIYHSSFVPISTNSMQSLSSFLTHSRSSLLLQLPLSGIGSSSSTLQLLFSSEPSLSIFPYSVIFITSSFPFASL